MTSLASAAPTLVLLRHGASAANEGKRFGGWDDVPLSELGIRQAVEAGRSLKAKGFTFDVAYTSMLQRAIATLWYCLEAMELTWLPTHKDWRLNERHYGALQGASKIEMAELHGNEKVQLWRRGYRSLPPALQPGDPRDAWGDPRYAQLRRSEVPMSESLHDTVQRVAACWQQAILPRLAAGQHTLVVAHGNSIRALMMILEGIGEDSISAVEVANGVPLVFTVEAGADRVIRRCM